jgi:hypothetical protein
MSISNQTPEKEVVRRIEVDRANATSKEVHIFFKADWDFQVDDQEELRIMNPAPGSWTPPCEGYETQPPDFDLAWVCCPKCKQIVVLDKRVHTVDPQSTRLSPDFRHQGCSFVRKAHFDKWGDKSLYAMKYHDRQDGMRIATLYTHADTAAIARRELVGVREEDIIAIGLAVGHFVDEKADKTGLILTAD